MSEQSRPQGELPELLSSRTAESAVLDGASTGVGLGSRSGFTGAVEHTPAGEVAGGHGGRTNDVDKRVHHAMPSDSEAKSLRAMADQSRTGKADSRRQEDDGASTVFTANEPGLSYEHELKQLQIIKAKTMYEMVEELDGGARKILFLTNAQVMDHISCIWPDARSS
jgi:hypothetical protein